MKRTDHGGTADSPADVEQVLSALRAADTDKARQKVELAQLVQTDNRPTPLDPEH